MKVFIVRSFDNGEKWTQEWIHGVFDSLKKAQDALPEIWKLAKFSGEPTKKTDTRWAQRWGNEMNGAMDGYVLTIEEVELNQVCKK
jgi:hypothetical protein